MEASDPILPMVLIAEGDHSVRALQAFFRGKAGFAVDFADDGEAAFA
jgi:hypothetical protein